MSVINLLLLFALIMFVVGTVLFLIGRHSENPLPSLLDKAPWIDCET